MLTATAVMASPIISQSELHYPVTGSNALELLAQMKAVGPSANGEHFDAVTEYFVKWDTTYLQEANRCKITSARVTLFTTTKYPQWTNYATADQITQQNWDNFLVRIHAHEQGHSNHGIEAANEVEAMLDSLPAMDSCDTVEATVKEKTNTIISKYKALDMEYDRVTHHGAEQVYA